MVRTKKDLNDVNIGDLQCRLGQGQSWINICDIKVFDDGSCKYYNLGELFALVLEDNKQLKAMNEDLNNRFNALQNAVVTDIKAISEREDKRDELFSKSIELLSAKVARLEKDK